MNYIPEHVPLAYNTCYKHAFFNTLLVNYDKLALFLKYTLQEKATSISRHV